MIKLSSKLLLISLLLSLFAVSGEAAFHSAVPDVQAEAAILMEAESGTLLFGKNQDERLPIASITKMMTALLILERCRPEECVTVRAEWLEVEGSSAGIRAGESYTVKELLYALMLASGNDAAQALAYFCSGSMEAFAELMNRKALELGMENSHFVNPHGLTAAEHYSTALDMGKLAAEAMKNSVFAEIVSTKEVTVGGKALKNHNKLLWNYAGANGIKTGYTQAAGRTLVSAAERSGMKLICVTLNDGNDWKDHRALLDWGFGEYTMLNLADCEWEIPLISGCRSSVRVIPASAEKCLLPRNAEPKWELLLPRFVYAPIELGDELGEAILRIDGERAASFKLCAEESAELNEEIPLRFRERLMWSLRSITEKIAQIGRK